MSNRLQYIIIKNVKTFNKSKTTTTTANIAKYREKPKTIFKACADAFIYIRKNCTRKKKAKI